MEIPSFGANQPCDAYYFTAMSVYNLRVVNCSHIHNGEVEPKASFTFFLTHNLYMFMTSLSRQCAVPEGLTGCNIPAKSTLPGENTHRGSPQSRSSLPNGTQRKCLEWRDNVECHLTIPDWGTVDSSTGLAYIPI